MIWWSLFTAATGLASGVASLTVARGLFGAGEAAAFPAASRSLVPWLPERQRAFGQGFQHAGSRFGAAIAPTLVVLVMRYFSWRTVFHLLGVVGIVWAAVWYWYYRNSPFVHSGVNAAEQRLLPPSPPAGYRRVPWRAILTSRDIWVLSAMYFCYGWGLWVYLQWLPTYLAEARHFSQLRVGLSASLPLLAATFTNTLGGWLSDQLTQRLGRRPGRLIVSIAGFLTAAVALIPAVLARDAGTSLWCLVVALSGLELTVAVSWAIAIDLGRHFSGSVSGVMGTWGNLGGAASAVVVAYLSTIYGLTVPLVLASGLCVLAAGLACFIDPTRSLDPAPERALEK
jgi:MFS family permease